MKYKLGKSLICLLLCFSFIPSLSIQAKEETLEIQNYINDYANLLDEQTEQKLNQAGKEFDEQTGAQIVFITIHSLNGQDIRQVAYQTFKKYGIGDKEADNGILFIVSMEEKQRYMEVGTGLEGTITDIASQHLQEEYLVTAFQSGQYSQGLETLYLKTIEAIQNGIDTNQLSAHPNVYEKQENNAMDFIPIIMNLFIIFLITYAYGTKNKQSILLKPGQKYKLNILNYDFNNETILISSENVNIVKVEANGWIQGINVGKTYIYLQKINEQTKIKIPVTVSNTKKSTNEDLLFDYMLWQSTMNNHHKYRNNHFRNNSGFGGFSGGGGSSRGGGAGGTW